MTLPTPLSAQLHIAMVLRTFSTSGGLELYAHKTVEGLLKHGYRVTVVCEESTTDLRHKNLTIEYFKKSPAHFEKYKRMQYQYQMANEKLLELGPFDIVHSQHFPIAQATVVTFHNHTVYRLSKIGMPLERLLNKIKVHLVPAYRLRNRFDQLLFSQASCRIFPSQICQNDFVEFYGAGTASFSSPLMIAPPGAELAQTNSLPEAAFIPSSTTKQEERLTFLFVGKGFRKKGLDVLLHACRLLAKRKTNFRLIIAGLRAKPIDKLRLWIFGLKDTVTYLGFQRDMQSVYSQSSVIIMPSRMEPFGMAALQAMRYGLVPIVSRVSGVSEILTHQRDALILEDHLDAYELATLMERLVNEQGLLPELSANAQRKSLEASWDKMIEKTLLAYKLALTKSGSCFRAEV